MPKVDKTRDRIDQMSDIDEEEKESLLITIQELHTQKIKIFAVRQELLTQNLTKIYRVIWGNCTSSLQTKVRSLEGFDEKYSANNCLLLLEELRVCTVGVDKKQNTCLNTCNTVRSIYLL